VRSRRPSALALCAALLLAAACSRSEGDADKAKAGARPPAVPVTAAVVGVRVVPVQIQAIGNVRALAAVSV
jgi:hypothetical protein